MDTVRLLDRAAPPSTSSEQPKSRANSPLHRVTLDDANSLFVGQSGHQPGSWQAAPDVGFHTKRT
jgi:hypothetical protein